MMMAAVVAVMVARIMVMTKMRDAVSDGGSYDGGSYDVDDGNGDVTVMEMLVVVVKLTTMVMAMMVE